MGGQLGMMGMLALNLSSKPWTLFKKNPYGFCASMVWMLSMETIRPGESPPPVSDRTLFDSDDSKSDGCSNSFKCCGLRRKQVLPYLHFRLGESMFLVNGWEKMFRKSLHINKPKVPRKLFQLIIVPIYTWTNHAKKDSISIRKLGSPFFFVHFWLFLKKFGCPHATIKKLLKLLTQLIPSIIPVEKAIIKPYLSVHFSPFSTILCVWLLTRFVDLLEWCSHTI